MISPQEIQKKASRLYPAYLSSYLSGEFQFPKSIRSDKMPSEAEFLILRKELVPLLEQSKDRIGFGYKVHLKTVKSKRLGDQQLPDEIVFETESDFLKYLRKESEVSQFKQDVNTLLVSFSQLRNWIQDSPQKIVHNAGHWHNIIKVLKYFIENPKPHLYIRELPILVHTKFIEQNKSIIEELFLKLNPESSTSEGKSFEERFYLKHYEPYFHLRILDKQISSSSFSGLTDIGITPSELSALQLPIKRVIIMENKQSFKNIDLFLSFPQLQDTIALFGSGFHSGGLKKITWLKRMKIFYWGDIDLHGFEILSALRQFLPQIQSFLMDEETFDDHKEEVVDGMPSKTKSLSGLTLSEMQIYLRLKSIDSNNRLEQEKISQQYVLRKMSELF
jgi:hypothetical protein